ncbi:MAG: large conductance mechanosensitive channel protein MscL [Actinobacteria bacterium]|nr:large conductance mechanosensitive channel protein MscL [Actinomycetota bacterium]
MKSFVKEFRDFIVTGNMIELAVGVILAGAVGAVIKVFTEDIVMNLVAAIFGKPSFNDVFRVKLNDEPKMSPDGETMLVDGTYLEFGKLLTSIVTLLLTGLVLFFIIKAYNKMRRPKGDEPAAPTEVELLTEIRDALRARN